MASKEYQRIREERFAAHVASGLSYTEAYRRAFKPRGIEDQQISERASRLRAKPEVDTRVKELLRQARIQDLDSVAEAFRDLLQALKAATDAENWTAVASLMRLRMQSHGMLQDRTSVSLETSMSDADLVRSLAGEDEHKAKMLQAVLAGVGFKDMAH